MPGKLTAGVKELHRRELGSVFDGAVGWRGSRLDLSLVSLFETTSPRAIMSASCEQTQAHDGHSRSGELMKSSS